MSKLNLNKANLEGNRMSKMTKKGYVTVSENEMGFVVALEVDETRTLTTYHKLSEITKLYDGRNWSAIPSLPVPSVIVEVVPTEQEVEIEELFEEDEKPVCTKEIIDVESDRLAEMAVNSIVETDGVQDDVERFTKLDLENKIVHTTLGKYNCTSKSNMFIIMSDLGLTPAEIAKETGANYSFIFGVLRRQGNAGSEATNRPNKVTKSSRIIEAYISGKTAKEICTELNAHPSFVHGVIKKFNDAN